MAIDPALEKDYEYFQSIKAGLLKEHAGKFVLIRNGEVVGFYDTDEAAYEEGVKRFGNVPILIAKIEPEEGVVWIPTLQLGLLNAGS